jgi:hypothetical protein
VDRFSRIVLGYHGCAPNFADGLISGEIPVEGWLPSRNAYDWLGHGIYFWEHGPRRALSWSRSGVEPNVVGAVIQLGKCLDFTDIQFTELLGMQYNQLSRDYKAEGKSLPRNLKGNQALDCLVINELVSTVEKTGTPFQTVRCPFLEGEPAFPSSAILKESHMQLAVIDKSCILGVFRPNLTF